MRRFELHQDAPSLLPPRVVSAGTGVVAEGVEFGDGAVVIRWLEDPPSTVVWPSVADAERVHGAAGVCTRWIDGASC